MVCVLLRRGMEGGHSCPKLEGQGRQGTRLNGNLASSEGEERAMALTITVEQTSAILTSRGAKKDAKATSNLERWKEWQSVSTLGRDSIRGSPWVQRHPRKLASPWPGDLKRSNTSGANQGAWGLGGGKSTLQAYAGLAWGGLLNLSARILGECHHRG